MKAQFIVVPCAAMRTSQADDRLRAAPHAHHQAAKLALAAQHGVGVGAQRAAAAGLDVQPGAEGPARALEHHHAHRVVTLEADEVVVQLAQELRVQRVQLLGAVQRDPVHRALLLDDQVLECHACLYGRLPCGKRVLEVLTWRN
jgi:hypothetical protein